MNITPPQHFKKRWIVLWLLFAATTINYLDRLLFSTLSPVLRDEFHFTPAQYGNLSAAFQSSYAIGFLVRAWVRLGPGVESYLSGTKT